MILEDIIHFIVVLINQLLSFFHLPSTTPTLKFSFGSISLQRSIVIGEGAYSMVYIGRNTNNPSLKYAVKKMIAHSKEMEDLIELEIISLNRFRHPNIIVLLGHIDVLENHRKVAYLAFPYISRGSLRDLLNKVISGQQKAISAKLILQDFIQILSAVNILHSFQPSYIHQDIKPENILIDSDGKPLLTDFGSVREANIMVMTRNQALTIVDEASRLCTVSYRAPELFDLQTNVQLDCRSDVWSLGCLLFAWRFGLSPFECTFLENGEARVAEASYSRVLSKMPRKPRPNSDDNVIMKISEWILVKDFNKRPFTTDVVSHVMDVLETMRYGGEDV